MGVTEAKQPSLLRWLLFGGAEPGREKSLAKAIAPGAVKTDTPKKAVKCDMCKGMDGGPACVRACPTGAALRVAPEQFLKVTQRVG